MRKIGFIGVGIMGKSMVRNLIKAGFELHIYARTKSKVEDVINEGAVFHDSIADCVKECEAVITIVGFPVDVEEVYFDKGNILDSVQQGTYLIDMTTTSPMLDQKIAEEGKKKGLHVLDAPVTGGDIGAKNGTLSILVGGEKADYEACMPLFEAMGTNINYQGGIGCGQHAKLANQIMIAGTIPVAKLFFNLVNNLIERDLLTENEVEKLKTKEYTKSLFPATDYPAIANKRTDNMGNSTQKRYRAKTVSYKGTDIYISTQFFDSDREEVIKWYKEH